MTDDRPARIAIPLAAKFNPATDGGLLLAHVSKNFPGYRLENINMEERKAYAVLEATVTEARARGGRIELRLDARYQKPSAGLQVAQKYQTKHPGYFLSEFDPFNGHAILTKMTPEEVRCRGALANVVGCQPWDVSVRSRKDGGFEFKLPKYTPSKHNSGLDEVAISVVGKPGWYVVVDASTLTGSIIPGEPPTFPATIPFPAEKVVPVTGFDKKSDKERFTLLLAEGLSEPGGENMPVTMSLDDANSLLLVGLPGSGKMVHRFAKLPVPMSKRFPTGWAYNYELVEGDLIYAPDGSVTAITGFSEWDTVVEHVVHTSDGQSTSVGPDHLWKARSAEARVVGKENLTKVETDALRAKAREFEGKGAVGTLDDIAKIAGQSTTSLYQLSDRIKELAVSAAMADDQTMSWRYCMDDLIAYWRGAGFGPMRPLFGGYRLTDDDMDSMAGRWMSGREIVTHLVQRGAPGELLTHHARFGVVSRIARARRQRILRAQEIVLYPVDETLFMLADEYDARAQGLTERETVVTTDEMMRTLHYSKDGRSNWALRVPEAIQAPEADLPVDPWLMGTWLGGSTDKSTLGFGGDDEDSMIPMIRAAWPGGRIITRRENETVLVHCIGLQTKLHEAGIFENKHIPASYRRASESQRLALLQGLMDTNGTVGDSGNCELSLDHEPLALDALELVRSLGIKASMTTSPGMGRKDRHRILFTTTKRVFRMDSKAERQPTIVSDTQRWNHVTSITVGEPTEMRCIKVAHPEHLFLVEGFIPTHNSVAVQSIVCQALIKGFRLAVIDTPAKKTDFQWAKPYVEDHWWGCDDDGTSVAEALTVATLVDEEGKRMGALLDEYGVGKWQELPEEVKKANPPVLIVADELANLLNKPTLPPGLPKEVKALPDFVKMAQDYLEAKLLTTRLNALVAVHRAAGVRELYLTQRPSKTEGFPPELKSLIPHRVLLSPSPSDSDIVMAFRDPKRIPRVPENISNDEDVARGAGIAHLDGANPVVIKGFYSSNEEFTNLLRKTLGPGDPSNARVRPTAEQIARCVPKTTTDDLDDDGPMPTNDRAPSGKSAAQVAAEMGDDLGVAMHDGSLGTGFEKANAMRNLAAGGGKTKSQREAEKQEARNAALSGDVKTTMMTRCPECNNGFLNPVTHKCNACGKVSA